MLLIWEAAVGLQTFTVLLAVLFPRLLEGD